MRGTIKKELLLEGLDCANCALKIEEEVRAVDGILEASMNFIAKTLTIQADESENMEEIIFKTGKIVNSHEPGVVVKEKLKSGVQEDISINKTEIVKLLISGAFFSTALIWSFSYQIEFVLYFISFLLAGGEVLLRAARNISKGQIFDENFLMGIATVGAFAIGEFAEGVAVMLFYQVGELFQDVAVNRSRKSIKALLDIRPDYANVKTPHGLKRLPPEEVKVRDVLVIKPGERVPLDATVLEGSSMMDTSALTGESAPREVEPGDVVLSGFINANGLLTVVAAKEFSESTVAKILDMVQNASSKKAPTENFITKFAKYYTPFVVLSAAALAVIPPLIIQGALFSEWAYRALIFLVISCPCALVISIPLGFFGGIGGASRRGILIKGSNYLEALNNVDTVVFDKTGTLTKGVFKVSEICAEAHMSREQLLEYAAWAESYSSHPIARSIVKEYGAEIDKSLITSCEELSGHGTKIKAHGKEIFVGNKKLMAKEGISYKEPDLAGTIVHIAVDKSYAGYILISDELKEDSAKALKLLREMGVKKLVMLTGDSRKAADFIAGKLGLDEVHAELLPDQKVEKLEALEKQKAKGSKLVFVGDGINDAPVLARADIGVAMGGLGSDAAIEAADIVLMTDEPSKLADAVRIAGRTRVIVWQNIVFALGIKGIVLLLGAGGIATMWEAVFADVGVAVLAILNAMRVMKVQKS